MTYQTGTEAGARIIFMLVDQNLPCLYMGRTKINDQSESNPCTYTYVIHDTSNTTTVTTALTRTSSGCHLMIYVSLYRTHDPKWKLFGCWTRGDQGQLFVSQN